MAYLQNSSVEQLIKGQANYKSDNLSFNLLISRLQKKYQSSQTPDELKSCLHDLNVYFEKYNSISAKDIVALNNL